MIANAPYIYIGILIVTNCFRPLTKAIETHAQIEKLVKVTPYISLLGTLHINTK